LRTDAPWIGRGFPGRAWCAMRTLPFDQYQTQSENAVSAQSLLSITLPEGTCRDGLPLFQRRELILRPMSESKRHPYL
jgi:hypothetical protein